LLASPRYGDALGPHGLEMHRYGRRDVRGLDPKKTQAAVYALYGACTYRDGIKASRGHSYDPFVGSNRAEIVWMVRKPATS